MIDGSTSRQPRAVRELEVVTSCEDDLDGQAVDLRAEQAVSRIDGARVWAEVSRQLTWAPPFTKPNTTG